VIEQLLALSLAALLASEPGAASATRAVRRGLVTQRERGDSVCVRFVGPWARQRALRLQADLQTTFRRRAVSFGCDAPRPSGARTPPSYQLSLTIDEALMREVTLAVSDTADREGGGAQRIERYVDLRNVPADGRHLAVVVAADELLDAARRARPSRSSDAEAPRAAVASGPPVKVAASPAPPSASLATSSIAAPPIDGADRAVAPADRAPPLPTAPEPAAKASPPPRKPPPDRPVPTVGVATSASGPGGDAAYHAAALSFAVEQYAGGQTHLGPDVAWRYGSSGGVFAQLGVGARKGLVVRAAGGVVESSLWTGRLSVGTGIPVSWDGVGLVVEVGARLGRLHLQGRADVVDFMGREATPWLCYADAVASLRVRIVGPVQARQGAGVGLPLLGQKALENGATVTAASGVAAQGQVGAMVMF